MGTRSRVQSSARLKATLQLYLLYHQQLKREPVAGQWAHALTRSLNAPLRVKDWQLQSSEAKVTRPEVLTRVGEYAVCEQQALAKGSDGART